MADLYTNIKAACSASGITPSAMCLRLGMSKSTMSDLKAGRKRSLSTETLCKIAQFLNVSADSLLNGASKERPAGKPADLNREDIKFAVFGDPHVDDDLMDDVMALARTMMEQRKKKEKREIIREENDHDPA